MKVLVFGLRLEHLVLVLILVLKKKSCSFQDFCCNSWRQWTRLTVAFCERQQKHFAIRKRLFGAPCISASVERYLTMGHTDASNAQWIDCGKLLSLGSNKPGKQTVHGLKCHLEKNATIFRYFDGIPSTRTTYKKGETRRGIGGWLGGWMYGKEVRKTLYYQVTFVFVFSAGNECPFSFSFRFRP